MLFLKRVYVFLIPVIFAVYAVLAFFSNNVQAVKFSDISWILVAAVILGGLVTGLFYIVFRDRSKASLVATCWMIIFFSYGQVYTVVHKSLGASIGRNVILLPLALVLMVLSLIWIWKLVRNPSWLVLFFSWMVAILFVMTFYSLGRYYISINMNKPAPQATVPMPARPASGPSIYYIILDAHGRQDILQGLYGYDNSEFIQFLKDQGFFVGDSSHSNYAQTTLSLSSSLNLQYLDKVGLPTGFDNAAGRAWLDGKIRDSLVREILLEQGYKLVLFNTDIRTAPQDAAVFYNFDTTSQAADAQKMMGPTEIEQMFIASTLGRVITDLGWFPKITDNQQLYYYHYLQTQYVFDKLSEVPGLSGKYFVYAHVIVPHPPFIFNSDGSYKKNSLPYTLHDGSDFPGTQQDYIEGYRDQVEYVDKVMEKVITEILSKSTPAPIIIIQADHGPGAYLDWDSAQKTNLDERMSILNAYYFPGGHSGSLYASITPVNSFRLLFSEYFGLAYPLLADKVYFSTWTHPFGYIDVTGKLK
jgi:Sulfatase